jgi:hypothetical protein
MSSNKPAVAARFLLFASLCIAGTGARAQEPAAAARAQEPGTAAQAQEPAAAAQAPEVPPWDNENAKLKTPIALLGYFWADTGYLYRTNAQPGEYNRAVNYMQGRFDLAGVYRKELGSFYALARLELVALVDEYSNSRYLPHVLDSYLKVGQKEWDVQLGRFLAWEVYYRGQGIELYTAEEAGAFNGPQLYWLDLTRGHMNGAGQAAIHWFPLQALGIELAGVYGQDSEQNYGGIRPVVDLSVGGLKAIAGYEYLKQAPQTEADKVEITSQGYAARVQYSLAPAGSWWLRAPAHITFSEEVGKGWITPVITVGVNFAHLSVDAIRIDGLEDAEKTLDKTSYGAFADIDFWKNSIGLGYNHTVSKNAQGEENTHDQAFVSYLFRLPIRGLSLKAVYGMAEAHIEDVDTGSAFTNKLQSVRVRARYDFE